MHLKLLSDDSIISTKPVPVREINFWIDSLEKWVLTGKATKDITAHFTKGHICQFQIRYTVESRVRHITHITKDEFYLLTTAIEEDASFY